MYMQRLNLYCCKYQSALKHQASLYFPMVPLTAFIICVIYGLMLIEMSIIILQTLIVLVIVA